MLILSMIFLPHSLILSGLCLSLDLPHHMVERILNSAQEDKDFIKRLEDPELEKKNAKACAVPWALRGGGRGALQGFMQHVCGVYRTFAAMGSFLAAVSIALSSSPHACHALQHAQTQVQALPEVVRRPSWAHIGEKAANDSATLEVRWRRHTRCTTM